MATHQGEGLSDLLFAGCAVCVQWYAPFRFPVTPIVTPCIASRKPVVRYASPIICLMVALSGLFVFTSMASAADMQPLADYVAEKDDAFRWVVRREGKIGATEYVELTLTSQKWKETLWKHQLFVIKPSTAKKETNHALFVIEGGSWHPRLAGPAPAADGLPREAPMFAGIAEQLGTPVAVLLQVPHQPIFGGRVEDAAIAHTFAQYLRTGDDQWPLLLPMVKSAVRGMDAVQQFAKRDWEMKLDAFTVTGASKRGWTTWLTGAVDPRATAIAPMVIDVLNMAPQMEHQLHAWGDYSRMIDDYTRLGLQKHLATEGGKHLRSIVDPYEYRDRIKQPKLIMLGTNDDYWPVDALNLYWDDLVGEKFILYVPNNRHGLRDLGRMGGTVNALHKHTNGGPKLPKLTWKFTETEDSVKLRVESDVKPNRVQVWTAASDTRDFRPSRFDSSIAKEVEGGYEYDLAKPESSYGVFFGEAVFNGDPLAFYLSTNVFVCEPDEKNKQ